ncbi:hypothetical protein CSB93_2037 [Pseudomonas paraeruginosa]|uniref:Uncharacterized protein n=1 Tax=Pseudomonas paraeruginosa TaxID=2994495 RepID=A0A2R3IW28_9PSED|nr:hypothetical protein CSB93_2037 [Pseudomonas paraeruginosa]AWE94568.1 hypothetical protein CSC28_0804 [Pseudomonas paraeruginosa]PTC38885.1 hypothetical protein CLJ1_0646 [Pseudomonas aeruginosa]
MHRDPGGAGPKGWAHFLLNDPNELLRSVVFFAMAVKSAS